MHTVSMTAEVAFITWLRRQSADFSTLTSHFLFPLSHCAPWREVTVKPTPVSHPLHRPSEHPFCMGDLSHHSGYLLVCFLIDLLNRGLVIFSPLFWKPQALPLSSTRLTPDPCPENRPHLSRRVAFSVSSIPYHPS